MKNFLLFICSFLVMGFFTLILSYPAFAEVQDGCIAFMWNRTGGGTGWSHELYYLDGDGLLQRDGTSIYAAWGVKTEGIPIKYQYSSALGEWVEIARGSAGSTGQYTWADGLATAWATSGYYQGENDFNISWDQRTETTCETCGAKDGITGETVTPGQYPPGPLCVDDCQADIGFQIYDPGAFETYSQYTFNGNECGVGDDEADPDIETCEDKETMCGNLCIGGDMDFSCDPGPPVTYSCGCELPTGPTTYNPDTSQYEPDQDGDGTGSGSDPDADGDGTDNGDDPDVDGDGTSNRDDPDVDGDATGNDGDRSWNPGYRTNSNGLGADPDVDGDGIDNGADDDIDGDGIPNGSDPDIDGDGVLNGPDLDADGDGVPDGSDSDADGDGLSGDDDPDPDGSTSSAGDTDGDGDTDSDDPAEPGDTEGDYGDGYNGGSCPDGQVCIGDGVCQSGEAATSADCVDQGEYFKDRWLEMKNNVLASDFGELISMGDIPTSSDSIVSVDFGETFGGAQDFDLFQFNFAWLIIKGLFLLLFSWISIKIILLGKT